MADLKDQTNRFYKEVFGNRNLAAIDELVADNAVEHEQPPPGVTLKPGREGVKQLIGAYFEGFNPLTAEVLDQYRDGNTVISRVQWSGTHSGTFAGIPPTGKTFSVEGIDIIRFDGDRSAEHWGQFDAVGMMTQLGLMPPM